MRKALLNCFETRDIDSFLTVISEETSQNPTVFVDKWPCKVHCHSRMPEDGSPMVECTKCKVWFHQSCESGNFNDADWICITCDRKKVR